MKIKPDRYGVVAKKLKHADKTSIRELEQFPLNADGRFTCRACFHDYYDHVRYGGNKASQLRKLACGLCNINCLKEFQLMRERDGERWRNAWWPKADMMESLEYIVWLAKQD